MTDTGAAQYEIYDIQPKSSGCFSISLEHSADGINLTRLRPRIIRYEGTWNVMAYRRRSVPFDNWEDARAFALCVFHCPRIAVSI